MRAAGCSHSRDESTRAHEHRESTRELMSMRVQESAPESTRELMSIRVQESAPESTSELMSMRVQESAPKSTRELMSMRVQESAPESTRELMSITSVCGLELLVCHGLYLRRYKRCSLSGSCRQLLSHQLPTASLAPRACQCLFKDTDGTCS